MSDLTVIDKVGQPDFPDAPVDLAVSVVLPCLNEESTVGVCILKAQQAFVDAGVKGEVIVCNNGSADRSPEIANELGARVIDEHRKGYGSALRSGIEAARGRFIVMADADDTYDLADLPRFIAALQGGAQFVMGSRFKGRIAPGAMPWFHRYVGTPVLTLILRILFGCRVSDSQCGMRAFTREAYQSLHLQTTGMEFASEMLIAAGRAKIPITELPVDYHPRTGESKLRSFRDGWRHLRFMLFCGPGMLFWVPGALLFLPGLLVLLALLFRPILFPEIAPRVQIQLLASLATLVGFDILIVGLYSRTLAVVESFEEHDQPLKSFYRHFTFEKGILLGLGIFLIGLALGLWVIFQFVNRAIDPAERLELGIFAFTTIIMGTQILWSSFFLSLLGIKHLERRR